MLQILLKILLQGDPLVLLHHVLGHLARVVEHLAVAKLTHDLDLGHHAVGINRLEVFDGDLVEICHMVPKDDCVAESFATELTMTLAGAISPSLEVHNLQEKDKNSPEVS